MVHSTLIDKVGTLLMFHVQGCAYLDFQRKNKTVCNPPLSLCPGTSAGAKIMDVPGQNHYLIGKILSRPAPW